MLKFKDLQNFALSLPEATEEDHFHKTSFRVKKKIFATYDDKEKLISVKLNLVDQDVFTAMSKGAVYPVPNKWGQQGWTFVRLDLVTEHLLQDIIILSFCSVAPKKLADQVKPIS